MFVGAANISPKIGVDDLLATAGPDAVLATFAAAVDPVAAEQVPSSDGHSYFTRDNATFRRGFDKSGLPVNKKVAYFTAEITADVIEDDGVEQHRSFEIRGEAGGRACNFRVPVDEFAKPNWPQRHLGRAAVVEPHQWPHVLAAIPLLSANAPQITRYAHIGWRRIGGEDLYLHAGGAIGPTGHAPDIRVALPDYLSRFELQLSPDQPTLVAAVRSLLRLLDVSRHAVSYPLLSVIGRAPLNRPPDFLVYLLGESGIGKSELESLEQRCWGRAMDRLHLPADWSGTEHSLNLKLFLVKNAILVIDDYHLSANSRKAMELQGKAENIIRSIGNQSVRSRMTSTLTLRPERPPRCMLLTSGEDLPRGHSLNARIFTIEMKKRDVNMERLTELQDYASNGLFAIATGEYIRWLSRDLTSHMKIFEARVLELQTQFSGAHARTPFVAAELQAGAERLLEFAVDYGAISRSGCDEMTAECHQALREVARGQQLDRAAHGPTGRFLRLLRSAVASNRAHFIHDDGMLPTDNTLGWTRKDAMVWGWKINSFGNIESSGDRLGAFSGDDVFLDPDMAMAAVRRLGRESGDEFEITKGVLHKHLHDDGILESTDLETGGTLTVRHTVMGKRSRYLHLRRATLIGEEEGY